MNPHPLLHLARASLFLVATILAIFVQGCASNGYISSSITTGIGLDVSENPQTQIPHVRFGYIRHGLYYIPTGKTGNPNGNVSETPHVVSKIHVSSEFRKGITIIEKFAVGDSVGNSAAARQLFADTSTETSGENVQQQPLVNISSSRQQVLEDRKNQAMAMQLIKAQNDGDLYQRRLAEQAKKKQQTPDNKTYSSVIQEINAAFPDRAKNPGPAKAAYNDMAKDPVLKKAGLPAIGDSSFAFLRVFQDKATSDGQRQALIAAATKLRDGLKE